ncbi:MAG: hypothetical protein MJ094_04255 [Saccharofermentans sp.]|nr:hypothetical protein [Saccharofermentans sp.]
MKYIINTEETEINIKDMLVYCLLRWRKVLCMMIIVGVILGGYMGYKKYSFTSGIRQACEEYFQDPAALLAKQEYALEAQANGIALSPEEQLSVYENQVIDEVAVLERLYSMNTNIRESINLLNAMNDYRSNSYLMRVNPEAVPVAEADIMISVSDDAPVNSVNVLTNAYINYLSQGDYLSSYAEEIGVDVKYLKEALLISDATFGSSNEADIYTITADPETNVTNDISVSFSSDTDNGRVALLVVKAIGLTEDEADALLSMVMIELNSYQQIVEETIAPHELSTINMFSSTVCNNTIRVRQDAIAEQIHAMHADIASYEQNRNDYSYQHKDNFLTDLNALPSPAKEGVKALIIYGAIGVFGVFMLCAVVYILKYILSFKVLTKNQLMNRFTLFDLGSKQNGEDILYKYNGKFDKNMRKSVSLGNGGIDAAQMAIANLEVFGDEVKTVLAVGNGDAFKALKDKNIAKVTVVDNLLENASSRKLLADVDGVILEVNYGKTRFDDIKDQIEFIVLAGKSVIGYIAD